MGQQTDRALDGRNDVAAAEMVGIREAHDEINDDEGGALSKADGLGESLVGVDIKFGQAFPQIQQARSKNRRTKNLPRQHSSPLHLALRT